ncbi:MAG: sigma-70 family RNA polymerase sigma factor [Pseudomonadota bacterium]
MTLTVRTMMTAADTDTSDAALLEATGAGDLAAFERLHRRFHRRLFGFAQRLTDRPELAEEVVSDTMLAVWRGASGFRGDSRPSTWIFGIAYRVAMRALSKTAHEKLHDEIDDEIEADRSGTDEVETLMQRRHIVAALRSLPPHQRATVELTYFYGYRLTEIAEITGCPVGTVKTRMFHARARLKGLLAGQLQEVGQ